MSSSTCPDEFYWNATQSKCIECTLGYYGHHCSAHCLPPFYGKGCQSKCVGCADHLCDVSYGCPNYSDASTFTTKLSTSSKLTTLERENKVFSTEKTVSSTLDTTHVFNPSLNTLGGISFYSIKEITTTLPTSIGSTTILPSFINSYYPILLGILGVCFLFLVIFTIYVSLHIHEKCSRKRKSRVIPDDDIETYQEIRELDVVGNFTKYDSLNRRARLAIPSSSIAQQGQLMEESHEKRKEREHDYSEINEKDIIIESYEADHSTRETDLATTESSTRLTSQQEEPVNIKDHSPPKDSDGYMLPKSGNPTLRNISESDSNASKRSSPQELRESTSNDRIDTTDDITDAYLTVIPK